MLFVLKKAISSLLLPFPLLLLTMAVGLLLLWCSRWQKIGKIILSCAWLLLTAISLQPIADALLRPAESRYPTWQQQQKIDYVVVLGGGYTWDANWAPSSNMLNNSLPRLTEGIRLWRENPGSKMIFTGAKAQNNPMSSAEVTSRVAQSLGVPAKDIITLDKPRDTEQEAHEVAKVVGDRPFLLVTSASHLPRAMIFFRRQGLDPFPAPANQLTISSPLNLWEKMVPSPLWLSHSEGAAYEALGRLWQRVTGNG
ncbi:envelope biogenesis factor ElyC [Erwinia tracheiphila]|uniref:Envelope biogenesis factor ElyC n=1 Tax=Erwinia tracheiphila TaxID=65700 RepID=A0A345CRZ2_9GAMM|nr:envelope biogenesis factor ElyC [Erwinia tracheiphila]AXF76209.1 envelope biogenesis factor ElyC [Erwinia tracheiphila]UIA85127.1 envelope biogenesis factor ElyC [Erwinia tracheiphila]UIA93728.1 envelope biogenesis factor ElyC [Erwinia tracheiphila]